ncbi:hypothetical protein SADUNF_Sadunf18G0119300 [Salix dunnii]|uniref:PNPLA domain-containing protein n=1 Tax=Salix dunnii TaxID=1413687 RepID=A0A835J5R4_9ROSI|nr:hypothetical protein SADUNF_Sadunf18G0119300 [Salix dunnii]
MRMKSLYSTVTGFLNLESLLTGLPFHPYQQIYLHQHTSHLPSLPVPGLLECRAFQQLPRQFPSSHHHLHLHEKLDVNNKYTRVANYFDFIAGTSTGGLMASMLTAPNDENNLCLLQKILLSFIQTIVQAPRH